jgi:hypothetical protein
MGFGHDVLVLNRDDRYVQADHLTGLARVVSRRGDYVVARNVTLFCSHDPGSRRRLLNRNDRRVAVNRGTTVARALRERLGQIGRLDIAIVGMKNSAHKSVGIAQRPELLDFSRRQKLNIDAYRLGGRGVLVVLVHAIVVHRQPKIADLFETDGLPRLCFEFMVKIHRVLVHLADAIAHIEQRQQTGRMPGRTRGKLGLLDQDDVLAPALLCEVIQRAHSHNTAANDNYFCFIFHKFTLYF